MQRSSIIATVVAAGGVLIAGSVASVAVINAASTAQPQAQTIQLVSADQSTPEPTATESIGMPTPSAAATGDPVGLPSIEAAELPALPTVDDGTPPAPAPVAAAPQAPAPARSTAEPTKTARPAKPASQGRPSAKPSATSSSSAAAEKPAAEISADQAVQLVLQATGGGLAQSVEKDEHNGFKAWAVRLTRHDGSVVTGYVDRSSGVIYDWVVNNEAPAPVSTSSGSSGSDDHEDDDREDDDHDDEDESEDD